MRVKKEQPLIKHHIRITSPKAEEEGPVRQVFFFLIKSALALGLVALLVWSAIVLRRDVLSNTDYFRLQAIEFDSNGLIGQEEAMSLINCAPDQYLLEFSTRKATKRLSQESDVKSASVSRILPHTLKIEITEHKPLAQLRNAEGELISLINTEGEAFKSTDRQQSKLSKLPTILESTYLQIVDEDSERAIASGSTLSIESRQAIKLLRELHKRRLKIRIKSITMANDYSFEIICLYKGVNLKVIAPFHGHQVAVDNFVEVIGLARKQIKLQEINLLNERQSVISVY